MKYSFSNSMVETICCDDEHSVDPLYFVSDTLMLVFQVWFECGYYDFSLDYCKEREGMGWTNGHMQKLSLIFTTLCESFVRSH